MSKAKQDKEIQEAIRRVDETIRKAATERKKAQQVLDEIETREEVRSWGGVREGAGRPLLRDGKAEININFRITESELEALVEQAEEGESRHKVAQRLLLQALSSA